jgi:hypothetical protein
MRPSRLLLGAALLFTAPEIASARLGDNEQRCIQKYGEVVERWMVEGGAENDEMLRFVRSGIKITALVHNGKVVMLTFNKEDPEDVLTVPEIEQLKKNATVFSTRWDVDVKSSDNTKAVFKTSDGKYTGWAEASEKQRPELGPCFKNLFLVLDTYRESWANNQSRENRRELQRRKTQLEE